MSFFEDIDAALTGTGIVKADRHERFDYSKPHYEVYFEGYSLGAAGGWVESYRVRLYAGYYSSTASEEYLRVWTRILFEMLNAIPCLLLRGIVTPEPEERLPSKVGTQIYSRKFNIADAMLEGRPTDG